MQKSPELIIDQARLWVGTRYHHQAMRRGVGVDCVGLIRGVGRELGLMGPETDAQFKAFDGYSHVPNPRRMREGMELFLDPADLPPDVFPGEGYIGWFEWRAELPMHLAIMATFDGRPTMIHAYKPVGRCVEHTFDDEWRGRINSFWKYRGMA